MSFRMNLIVDFKVASSCSVRYIRQLQLYREINIQLLGLDIYSAASCSVRRLISKLARTLKSIACWQYACMFTITVSAWLKTDRHKITLQVEIWSYSFPLTWLLVLPSRLRQSTIVMCCSVQQQHVGICLHSVMLMLYSSWSVQKRKTYRL